MVSVAGIKINRGSGSSEGNLNKEILKELKKLNAASSRSQKLGQSGLAGGGGDIISSLLGFGKKTVGTAVAAVGGMSYGAGLDHLSQNVNVMKNLGRPGMTGAESYRKGDDGTVERYNTMTGETLDILTEEQAIEKGILDDRHELLEIYQQQSKAAGIIQGYYDELPENTQQLLLKTQDMVTGTKNAETALKRYTAAIDSARRAIERRKEQEHKSDSQLIRDDTDKGLSTLGLNPENVPSQIKDKLDRYNVINYVRSAE